MLRNRSNLRLAVPVLLSGRYRDYYAIDFDATNKRVVSGTDSSINNIFATGGTIGGRFYIRSDGSGNNGRLIEKRLSPSDTEGFILKTKGESAGFVELDLLVFFSGSFATWDTTTASVPVDTWIDLYITYNGDDVGNSPIFYLNASSLTIANVVTPSGTINDDSTAPLYIGNNSENDKGGDFICSELLLLDVVLTPTQVTEAHNNGEPYDHSRATYNDNIVLRYTFENETYPTITDRSGNGNDGTMVNMSADDIVPVT